MKSFRRRQNNLLVSSSLPTICDYMSQMEESEARANLHATLDGTTTSSTAMTAGEESQPQAISPSAVIVGNALTESEPSSEEPESSHLNPEGSFGYDADASKHGLDLRPGRIEEKLLDELSPSRSTVEIVDEGDGGDTKVEAAPDFFNYGLEFWEKSRATWLATNRDETRISPHAKPLEVDEIIDAIFAAPRQWRETTGPTRFPTPVPLPQMIDILQDLWEAEGLEV